MGTPGDVIVLSTGSEYTFENKWYYEIAQPSHFWIDGRIKALLKLIRKLDIGLQGGLKGMEIGCGNGVVRYQLESCTDWVIDASDLDLCGLQLAQKGRGHLYRYNILEQNQIFKEKYNFLILFDVIEHIADVPKFLSSCLFHLKKGGYIFINVPALQVLYTDYDRVQGHQKRYNKISLNKTLEEAGLQILDLQYWGFCLVPLVFARKILSSSSKDPEVIIRQGFQPPSSFLNWALCKILSLESKILPQPPLGTSLMAVVKKK